jgi:hypothetical protein
LDIETVDKVLSTINPSLLIHGAAKGADTLCAEWAEVNNVEVEVFPANWERYGRRAGPLRNISMLERTLKLMSDGSSAICAAFPLPDSVGTRHMMRLACESGIVVVDATYPFSMIG